MAMVLLLGLLFGAVWGFAWAFLDLAAASTNFMNSSQLMMWIRSFLIMLVTQFVLAAIFGLLGLAFSQGILTFIVAMVAYYFGRQWLVQRFF